MPKSLTAEPSTAPRRKLSLLLLLGLSPALLATSSGCRSTTDNQIDLLERELRVQEDYIYELEDYVVEYSEKLRDCRSCPQQTAVYAEEIHEAEPAPQPAKKSSRRRSDKERSVLDRKKDEMPAPFESDSPAEIDPEDLEVPDEIELEIGEPVSQVDEAGPLRQVATNERSYELADDGTIIIPNPVDYQSALTVEEIIGEEPIDEALEDEQFAEELFADELIEPSSAIVEYVAERLEVKQLFRGAGEELSPQSLLTVVEALDANDEPVDLNGEVSLMVMTVDQSKPQRLKRWNFTAEETVSAWQSSDLGDGLHLELPLEKLNLPTEPLELWVRLVTADGRKLLTQLPFEPSRLSDVASAEIEPQTQGLSLARAEIDSSVESINSLRIETKTIPSDDQLKLTESQPLDNQPRWRASMQRTDRTAEGFATTSGISQGWTRQAPGRQPYLPPRLATRPSPAPTSAPAKPVWTSGRSR